MKREAASGKQGGRTVEIQRLIGRSLRAACDLGKLGERQIIKYTSHLLAQQKTPFLEPLLWMLFAYIGPLSNQQLGVLKILPEPKTCLWKSFICVQKTTLITMKWGKIQANPEMLKAIVVAKETESKVNTI